MLTNAIKVPKTAPSTGDLKGLKETNQKRKHQSTSNADIPKKRLKPNPKGKSTSTSDGETFTSKATKTRGTVLKRQKEKAVNLDNARISNSGVSDSESEDTESDGENVRHNLLHESLVDSPKKRNKQKKNKVLDDETPETRYLRTIFVGNLPLDVLSKRVCE